MIEFEHPLPMRLVYSGWWFRQTIEIDGIRIWSKISWLSIESRAEFRLPHSVDSLQRPGKLEIDFSRGLRIRRFRIWLGDELAYDEITQ